MSTFKEIPAFQLETIYRVMLKRIAKGYTADQLSFLMGASTGYIKGVETLEQPFYSSDDLERIAQALEESNFESFFPWTDDESVFNISFRQNSHAGKEMHTYLRIDEQGEEEELYTIKEDPAPDFDLRSDRDPAFQIAKDAVQLLSRAGYFYEAKLPYQVAQKINFFFGYHLSSHLVYRVMLEACDPDKDQTLRVVEVKEGVFGYES